MLSGNCGVRGAAHLVSLHAVVSGPADTGDDPVLYSTNGLRHVRVIYFQEWNHDSDQPVNKLKQKA